MRDGAIAAQLDHGEVSEEVILQVAVRRRERAEAHAG
jgi:hypothetical protein